MGVELGGLRLNFVRACVTAMLLEFALGAPCGRAVEAINVRTDAQAIDLTDSAERYRSDADRLLVSAAPGPDGIIRRMDVRAREGNTNWAVFALANSGDEQIERLIVVPHYRMVGSGVFWPDLGLSRIVGHLGALVSIGAARGRGTSQLPGEHGMIALPKPGVVPVTWPRSSAPQQYIA